MLSVHARDHFRGIDSISDADSIVRCERARQLLKFARRISCEAA